MIRQLYSRQDTLLTTCKYFTFKYCKEDSQKQFLYATFKFTLTGNGSDFWGGFNQIRYLLFLQKEYFQQVPM